MRESTGSLNPSHQVSRVGAGALVGRVRSAAALWNLSSTGVGFRYEGPTAQPDTQSSEKRLIDARATRKALEAPALSETDLMWAPCSYECKPRRLAVPTPSIQCSVRRSCCELRSVARMRLAQQNVPHCHLRVAIGNRTLSCLGFG